MNINDTIAAVVTAMGEGAVGIIRLSGPEAYSIADSIFRGKTTLSAACDHSVNYGRIYDGAKVLDEVLALVMRAPKSYTGEDVVELQCHGGMLVMERLLALVLAHGARLAEPGEFSKRAFLNGKMDLTAAESIMDIVSAKAGRGLEMALNQRFGSLRGEIGEIRAALAEMIAYIQADIDYPEDDIERLSTDEYQSRAQALKDRLDTLAGGYQEARIWREGLQVVLAGRPNVGKSSLLNALVQDERAIVTPIAGTTRDVISEYISLGGLPIKIIDTAGIRQSDDVIEQIGVEKSRRALENADLVLYVLEGDTLTAEDSENIAALGETPYMFVCNKSDVINIKAQALPAESVSVSALTGSGLDTLAAKVKERFIRDNIDFSAQAVINNARHLEAVSAAQKHITAFIDGLTAAVSADFLVIDLQSAWEDLGKISGETIEEDLLDVIFAKFCLGK